MSFCKALCALLCILGLCSLATAADFGYPVYGPVTQTCADHGYNAIDIAGNCGNNIGVAKNGHIESKGYESGGGGYWVKADHGSSYITTYCHLSGYISGVGATVYRPNPIAYVGNSGHSTGCHCHFDIRRSGTRLYIPSTRGVYVNRGQDIPYDYPGI